MSNKTALRTRKFTTISVGLLVISGLLMSVWLSKGEVQSVSTQIVELPWVWWRGLAYSSLLIAWPWLLLRLAPTKKRPLKISRRPLVFLIVFYECVIVQNPLALLLNWIW